MTPETIPIDPPLVVMLRNKMRAFITHGVDVEPFNLLGRLIDGPKDFQLWMRSGHWHESKGGHPLDIVGLQCSTGEFIAFQGLEFKQDKGGAL